MSLLLLFQSPVGGPTSYSLTCNAGSYTYTGQSATVTVARNLTANAGSYTYTGQSATVRVGRNLTATVGSYTYTGQSATVRVDRNLTGNAGSYTYTGQSATITVARNLTANAGAYVYTGQDATLTTTAATNYTLTCEAGAYTYTGQSATLTTSAQTQTAQAGGGRSKRKKWPKRVMLRGRLYTVRNWEEELSLLQAALDRAQYQAAVTPSIELEKPIPRLQRRLKKVESERDRWIKRLKQADEELILLLH